MRQRFQSAFGVVACLMSLWPNPGFAKQDAPITERAASESNQKGRDKTAQTELQKPCFETQGAETSKEREDKALADLAEHSRAWLTEDVVYIITPEERCEFLHLETSDEQNQFIEQFWLRRNSNPDLLDNDFKDEHYRRILFANEKFSTEIPGWNTDRGRVYILFGPPDKIESHSRGESTERPPEKEYEGGQFPWERWHYRYLEGFGADVDLDFVDPSGSGNYRLALDAEEKAALLSPPLGLVFSHSGLVNRRSSRQSVDVMAAPREGQQIIIYTGPVRFPPVRFKDLEAIVTSRIIRDQVYFGHEVQYLKATHASTVAQIVFDIPDEELSTNKTGEKSGAKYEIFARVSKLSGWVVDTIELSGQASERLDPTQPDPNREVMVALEPGTYELAIAVKDVNSGRVGVTRVPLFVSRYEDLDMKKDAPALIIR
jgi:GWxTD domain-containing protein